MPSTACSSSTSLLRAVLLPDAALAGGGAARQSLRGVCWEALLPSPREVPVLDGDQTVAPSPVVHNDGGQAAVRVANTGGTAFREGAAGASEGEAGAAADAKAEADARAAATLEAGVMAAVETALKAAEAASAALDVDPDDETYPTTTSSTSTATSTPRPSARQVAAAGETDKPRAEARSKSSARARSTAPTPRSPDESGRVWFNSPMNSEIEITPYSSIYGMHPRYFNFDGAGGMVSSEAVAAAPINLSTLAALCVEEAEAVAAEFNHADMGYADASYADTSYGAPGHSLAVSASTPRLLSQCGGSSGSFAYGGQLVEVRNASRRELAADFVDTCTSVEVPAAIPNPASVASTASTCSVGSCGGSAGSARGVAQPSVATSENVAAMQWRLTSARPPSPSPCGIPAVSSAPSLVGLGSMAFSPRCRTPSPASPSSPGRFSFNLPRQSHRALCGASAPAGASSRVGATATAAATATLAAFTFPGGAAPRLPAQQVVVGATRPAAQQATALPLAAPVAAPARLPSPASSGHLRQRTAVSVAPIAAAPLPSAPKPFGMQPASSRATVPRLSPARWSPVPLPSRYGGG